MSASPAVSADGRFAATNLLILLVLTLVWGSSFILIKKSLVGLGWYQMGLLRIILAGLALLPWSLAQIRHIPRHKLGAVFLVGFFGSGIPPFLFAFAQTQLDSGPTGILNSLTPISTLVVGMLFFGARTTASRLVGLGLGLIGAIGMITVRPGAEFAVAGAGGNYGFGIFVVMATVCYAFSTNVIKSRLQDVRALAISSVSLGMIAIPALLLLSGTDFFSRISSSVEMQASLGYIALLAVFGTSFASIIYFKLVQRTDPLFASVVTYTIPIVAVAWGLWDGENLHAVHLIGLGLILTGVYLTGRSAPAPSMPESSSGKRA